MKQLPDTLIAGLLLLTLALSASLNLYFLAAWEHPGVTERRVRASMMEEIIEKAPFDGASTCWSIVYSEEEGF